VSTTSTKIRKYGDIYDNGGIPKINYRFFVFLNSFDKKSQTVGKINAAFGEGLVAERTNRCWFAKFRYEDDGGGRSASKCEGNLPKIKC
jgi:hypothetical protein